LRTFLPFIIFFLPLLTKAQEKVTTEGIPGDVNSTSQDVRPIISDDGKKLYLNRRFHPENIKGDKDFQDVWVSTYDPRGIWTKPKNLGKEYNDKKANDLVRASKNDDSLIFVNTKYRGVSSELALFTKGNTDDPKELPIDGYYNNSPYVDFDYNFKHKVILMAVERKDSEGDQDLYYSVYQENSKRYSTPMNMGKSINSDKADFAPFLTNDGNTLFYASYGHNGQGSADLFMAHRTGDGWDEWTTPENLGKVINTKFEETFVSIDPSFDYLYYDSYPSGAQNRNIWRATLSEEIKEKIINAKNRNKREEKPIEQEELIEQPKPEDLLTENKVPNQKAEVKNTEPEIADNKPSDKELETTKNAQPVAVTIDQEMNYHKEQERNNQGFLSNLGKKLGFGGEEEIQLIEAGSKGKKINRNVYFKFDSDKLQGKFNMLLDKIADELEKNPQIKILLEGHTDAIGGEDVNIDLSCNRADIVKEALIERGINKYRIEISCEGKERPIATNDDEYEGRELNRRVEFYFF